MEKLPESTIEQDGLLVTVSRDGRLWLDCCIDSYKGIHCEKARRDGYPAGFSFAHYGAGFSVGLRVPFGVSLEDIEKMCSGRYRLKGERRLKVHPPTVTSSVFADTRDAIRLGIREYPGTEIPKWADALIESEHEYLLKMIERNKVRQNMLGESLLRTQGATSSD